MRFLNHCIAGAYLISGLDAAAANDHFLGQFWGTGRACYGTLTITRASLEWLTTFNRCRSSPYKVLEQSGARMTVRLTSSDPGCPFKVLSVTHDAREGPDNGWDVSGYLSESSYRSDKATDFAQPRPAMSCYLIRDPDFVAPTD
jgi:hypothetical protein